MDKLDESLFESHGSSVSNGRRIRLNRAFNVLAPFFFGFLLCYFLMGRTSDGTRVDDSLTCDLQTEKIAAEMQAEAEQRALLAAAGLHTLDEPTSFEAKIEKIRPKIGLVSMIWGEGEHAKELHSAASTHKAYTDRHDYPHYLLEKQLYNGIWSKPSTLLSIILTELVKPDNERLQWLVWADIDTLVMNSNVRLEEFIPPAGFEEVYLLTTNDIFGLNNGVFLIKVDEWSVKLFTHTIAFPYFNPTVQLGNSDQTAMGYLLQDLHFSQHALIVPQHFFNGYRPGMLEGEVSPPGALFMHFPGGNKKFIPEWMEYLQEGKNETWNLEFAKTNYPTELKDFWDGVAKRRDNGLPLYVAFDKH